MTNTKGTLSQSAAPISTSSLNNQQNSLPSFITAYGPKLVVQTHFTGPGRTKQAFKEECDINTIMARYLKSGVFDFVNKYQGQYGDVTAIDYQQSMEQIAQAKSMFQDLPSNIRDRFANDPAHFLDFVHDPKNEEEMHDLGLMQPGTLPPSKRPPPADPSKPQASSEPEKPAPKPDK